MESQVVFSESLQLADLTEVNRLIHHIHQTAIDSENIPIRPSEVLAVGDRVIHILVWQYPHLEQVIQESLDDLRFRQ